MRLTAVGVFSIAFSITQPSMAQADHPGRIRAIDLQSDAEIFAKAAQWSLRFSASPSEDELSKAADLEARSQAKLNAINQGDATWIDRKGSIIRGHRSQVDDSVEPYGVIIPKGYLPGTPVRVDIILHGSVPPNPDAEVRFIEQFDKGDDRLLDNDTSIPVQPFIKLHPCGSIENGYSGLSP